jgi:hypothetical protein
MAIFPFLDQKKNKKIENHYFDYIYILIHFILVHRTAIANAGHAAVASQIEIQLIQVVGQSTRIEVGAHYSEVLM